MSPAPEVAGVAGQGTVSGPDGVAAAARDLLRSCFGQDADGVWFAPGRANLMGEHTDYNDGFVLPFALSQGAAAAAARRPDRRLVLCSAAKPGTVAEIELDGLAPGQVSGWAAYPAGVAWALMGAGYEVPGAFVAFGSDLPMGAGLSSSAALECATALALTGLGSAVDTLALTFAAMGWPDAEPEADPLAVRRALAAITQRAENEFVGVPCGIMDQSASLLGRAGHALLLDCRSRETIQVPLAPAGAGARLLVIDTRARHKLAAGQYAQRRAECERAARLLDVQSLREVTDPDETGWLTDDVLRRRARHVVSDNQRTWAAARLLASGADYGGLGRLLTEAHRSLRDDFEVSWPEADVAVDAALAAGAFGARMMGGGFGGSVLALVPDEAGDRVRDAVSSAFGQRSWLSPQFSAADPSDGARRVGLQ